MNYQECNVVMLPTENLSKVCVYINSALSYTGREWSNSNTHKCQHLYITNPNEEIKEGDWCITNQAGISEIGQCTKIGIGGVHYFDGLSICFSVIDVKHDNKVQKIIATTDESLQVIAGIQPMNSILEYSPLPQIPTDLIKLYCEQGGIDKVLVEYVSNSKYIKIEQGEYPIGIHRDLLKVSPDNTISIKPTKESWNREEVIELIRVFGSSCIPNEFTEKWIKENL